MSTNSPERITRVALSLEELKSILFHLEDTPLKRHQSGAYTKLLKALTLLELGLRSEYTRKNLPPKYSMESLGLDSGVEKLKNSAEQSQLLASLTPTELERYNSDMLVAIETGKQLPNITEYKTVKIEE